WQMEFQRRIGHGRLSEIFGDATVPQDRFLRTVGFGRAARSAWASTPDWAKQQIDAYVAGINAFIAAHHGTQLPPEFSLLRFEPEPFTGPDVLVWVRMMAWDLSANYAFELLRHDLTRLVGAARMKQLMPPYAADGLSILPNGHSAEEAAIAVARAFQARVGGPERAALQKTPFVQTFRAALDQGNAAVGALLGDGRIEGLGSNNWVVDGTMSATGKPLLANGRWEERRVGGACRQGWWSVAWRAR